MADGKMTVPWAAAFVVLAAFAGFFARRDVRRLQI
jgi:hypothetical protein